MAVSLKTCVVCGAASHRDSWINKLGDEVACDSHSKDEVAGAVRAKANVKPVAPAPAAETSAVTQEPKKV